MNIRTFYTIAGDVFTVTINTEQWSEGDMELMAKFGEPEIDLGGDFGTYPPTFTLPNLLKRIRSESPFSQSFDKQDDSSAEAWAKIWGSEMATRISAAIATLRDNVDDYSKEEVVNV